MAEARLLASDGAHQGSLDPTRSFQGLILALQQYWANWGCVILQPYDMEVGAGTFHPATTLRALGPKPWNAAYVQPSRRPKDGRYGENPNRLQHYYQFQVILKPSPPDIQDLYLKSLQAIGIDSKVHDIRFVEDDWESPTLGACRGGTHIRARATGDVCAGRRQCVRAQLQRPHRREEGHLWRRLPAGGAGILPAQFRVCRHRDAVRAIQDGRGRLSEISRGRLGERQEGTSSDGAPGL